MSECCCPESVDVERLSCLVCGTAAKPVDSLTVKALLTEAALRRFVPALYRFCPDAACAVTYFAEGGPTFDVADMRVAVWQKEPVGRRMICYCFGESEAAIASEIDHFGESCAIERIRTHIAAGRCACEVRNPRGVCCLGDIAAAVERIRRDRLRDNRTL
jgi:Zinc binding domain